MSTDIQITDPIPIFLVGNRYYLYNVHHISHLRQTHNIPGVLIGTLPQAPQQNVFLGLPLQLMPEEARLMVERKWGYVVDDVKLHQRAAREMDGYDKRQWKDLLREEGLEISRATAQIRESKKHAAIDKLSEEEKQKALASLSSSSDGIQKQDGPISTLEGDTDKSSVERISSVPLPAAQQSTTTSTIEPYGITPTTSDGLVRLPDPPGSEDSESMPFSPFSPRRNAVKELLPSVPSSHSYELYEHLHSLSYFISPGLRFGAQYTVYPGDPLRFHSHFLADGLDWDEEVDLMRLVGGGRLGTGVKKAFLIGGRVKEPHQSAGRARCFCIEWGGM